MSRLPEPPLTEEERTQFLRFAAFARAAFVNSQMPGERLIIAVAARFVWLEDEVAVLRHQLDVEFVALRQRVKGWAVDAAQASPQRAHWTDDVARLSAILDRAAPPDPRVAQLEAELLRAQSDRDLWKGRYEGALLIKSPSEGASS